MGDERQRETSGKVTLTQQAVVGAAFSLADSEGLESVTIRRLARDLGVTPMALYWHFRSKDELLDGMVKRLYEEVPSDTDGISSWQERFRALFGSILDILRDHPSTAGLFATRNVVSEDSLRVTEAALDILAHGGFSPTEATQIVRHSLSTVTNLVRGLPGAADSGDESGELLDSRRRTRVFLEALPPERYPRIVEAAAPLSACEDEEAYYEFGLDLLLSGIEVMSGRRG